LSGSLGDLLTFLRAAQAQRPEDHPVLIVIDIFADTMSGEDENAAATMVPVLRRARIISKLLHATVLLIHHASKARPRARNRLS
jgi:RecA-family ATPase